jgi:RHS repeat-associated protein
MRKLFPLLLVMIFATAINAQNYNAGIPRFGSFDTDGFDTINNQNLNVNFTIPIMNSPGRGLNLNLGLSYNSSIWSKVGSAWTPDPTWGWTTSSPIGKIVFTYTTGTCQVCVFINHCQNYTTYQYGPYSYVEPNGTAHSFPVQWNHVPQPCYPYGDSGTKIGYASDGSGFYLDASTGTAPVVYTPSGSKITTSSMIDTNGNTLSSTYVSSTETDWSDSVGRTGLRIVTNTLNSNIGYDALDLLGQISETGLGRSTVNIKTNFACPGIVEYTGSAILVTQITLPVSQTSYTITYEPTPGASGYYTGRVQRITLPTGGYYEFDYSGPNDAVNCQDGTAVNVKRVMSDGTNTSAWQFTRTLVDSTHWKTIVTAPQMPYDTVGNDSVHIFTNGQETSQQTYQGSSSSGTLLRTANTTWNGLTPATKTAILDDGQTQSEVETSYDTYGNLLSLKEHDWGTGAPGPVLRTTSFSYLPPPSGTNLVNRLTQKTIKDASGTVKFRQDIAYDSTPITICPTGVPGHNDGYGCSATGRGNPTSVTNYTNAAAPSGAITKNFTYDSFGNVVQADVDCCQQKKWNFSAATQYSLPDSEVSGPAGNQITTSFTYNQYRSWLSTMTDPNGLVTTYYRDGLDRPTATVRPDGVSISGSYTDGVGSSGTGTIPIQGSDSRKTTAKLDNFGRTIKTTTADKNATAYSISETQYDPLGRAYFSYNPHNSTRQYKVEQDFDALGRNTKTILQDGSLITTSYVKNTVTTTDPAGSQRKLQYDGFGRLVAVFEPDVANSNQLTQQTSYAYSVLDAVTTVTQGVQTRTKQYDDIGRVTSMTTSEAGTVSYQYNNFGLVTQKTDARNVQTNYSYDSRNRLTGLSYTIPNGSGVAAMPNVCQLSGETQPSHNVCFYYDEGGSAANAFGRLTHIQDATGTESYTFDPKLPRTTQVQKVLGGATYTIKYGYNFAGELTSITYPSNRVVQQTFDGIGRASLLADGSSGNHFQDSFTYDPAFHATAFNYGNGVAASLAYSADRMQLQTLTYAKSGSSLFGLTYAYGTSGSNNGQIAGITDSVDAGRTGTYLYDALGRLTQAYTAGSAKYPKWDLKFAYDRYGNRLSQTVQSDTSPNLQPPPPGNSLSFANPGGAQTNRQDNMCFDASGNLLTETPANPCPPSAPMYTYDGENRLVDYVSALPTYVYDGNGLRVKKCLPNCTSPTSSTIYIFSGSRVIAEYDNGAAVGSPSREYIHSRSGLLAKIDSSGTKYYHQDHLSNRLITDSNGNALAQLGHYPFGESWYNTANDKLVFTTYERDSESSNDYALARYNINRYGRFNSPDSLGGSLANPQSSNRYTYSLNGPTNLIDPSGHFVSFSSGGGGTGGLFGSDGSGGGFDCVSDGIDVPCWLASMEIESGAGVQCPNNACTTWTFTDVYVNGQIVASYSQLSQFRAFWSGAQYYPISGPGSINYSEDQAGAAAGEFFLPYSKATHREFSGSLTQDAEGFFSYDLEAVSQVCQATKDCIFSFDLDPNAVASWHTHPFQGNIVQFLGDRTFQSSVPRYITTGIGSDMGTFRTTPWDGGFHVGGAYGPFPPNIQDLNYPQVAQICRVSGPSFPGISACR